MDVGNDLVSARNVTANVGSRYMGMYHEFGLEMVGQ